MIFAEVRMRRREAALLTVRRQANASMRPQVMFDGVLLQ